MDDRFQLQRFVDAQQPVYEAVLNELRTGRKRSHWMWFIFPQISGLGHSATAQTYAVSSLAEAAAYLAHPTLGSRLRECSVLVASVEGRSVDEIFGYPDNLKFHSSRLNFRQIQDAIDEFKLIFGVQQNPFEVILILNREIPRSVLQQQIVEADDRVQGRAKFMAHAR